MDKHKKNNVIPQYIFDLKSGFKSTEFNLLSENEQIAIAEKTFDNPEYSKQFMFEDE